MSQPKAKVTIFNRFLNMIEVVGNKLPNPVSIFFMLCGIIMILSVILSANNVAVENPSTQEIVSVVNLFSIESLKTILNSVVGNFQSFPPLGLVLVVMIGAGLAEKSKFMETALKLSVVKVPNKLLTVMIFFVGIIANAAGDAGFIVLPPLAAIVYISVGRHPFVGIFAAFAGCAAGFAANIMVSMSDILLYGFTIPAAQTINPDYSATPAMNLYFLIASTVVLVIAGTWVTERIIAPRFENEDLTQFSEDNDEFVSEEESKAVFKAVISLLVYLFILVLLAIIPLGADGVPFLAAMDDAGKISVLLPAAPLMKGIVPIITLSFFIPGLVYGVSVKTIKNDHDAIRMIGSSLAEMGPYILLAFAASQFIALFTQSNLGIVIAVSGANILNELDMPAPLLMVCFILFSAFLNLFIGSASAKWAMLAPIFIPMFLLLDYEPALTQMAYRIGDSISNPISPLFPYFPILLGFLAKYKKDVGVGTIISNMIPYSLVFGVVWSALLIIFMVFGIPLGPA